MQTYARASLLLPCLLPAVAPAQNISQGPFVGAPHMLTVDASTWNTSGTQLLPTNVVLYKNAGIQSSTPLLPFPIQGVPDIGRFLGNTNARIDGLSGGLDWIQANAIGEHAATAFGLGALTFSVTRDTTSAPGGNGQVIFDEWLNLTNNGDGAAGDLFSFILPGSTLAPPAWQEVTMRAQNSTEISLFGGPGKPGDLAAHDLFLIAFQQSPSMIEQILPIFTGVYFTVSKDTVGLVNPAWWQGTTPSGATILWSPWDHANRVFLTPRPFKTYSQLNLAFDDDVIAVSYDAYQRYLLFATNRDDIDPLRFAHFDPAGNVLNVSTYRMPVTGQPISERMGISITRRDKIDAICALDPFVNIGGSNFTWAQLFGMPRGLMPGFPGTGLSAGASRLYEVSSTGPEYLVSCFTGWPKGGPPQPGAAVAIVADPTYTLLLTVGVFTRNPADPNGDPQQVLVQMPKLPPNSIRLGLHWAVLTGSFLDVAPPAWIDW
jgi:hypothetical protein